MNQQRSFSELDRLTQALDSGAFQQIRFTLNNTMQPVEVAQLLEKSPPKERRILWQLIHRDNEGAVLQHVSDDIQADILSRMDHSRVLAIADSLDTDDLADLLQQLPDTVMRELLKAMDKQNRERVEQVLSFPEDTAGGLMNTDTVTIRPDISVETVLRYIRRHDEIPEMTDSLFVISRRKQSYIGILPLTKLLVSDPDITVREIMVTDIEPIPASMPDHEVAQLFEQLDLVSAPVVDPSGKLLGRITIDDVVDVIREDADHSLMSMAGLDDDEDTFAPVWKTSKRRAVWLGINLITAFIASAVIGIFQDTIDKVVALAVLMPIVASMGGIAGSQTLTLIIRAQALDQVEKANAAWLVRRELMVGAINGLLWSVVVAGVAVLWFGDYTIGLIIGLAIIINLIVGTCSGSLLPILLKAKGVDPALAGGVVLTTITDVVGFLAFLGLATYFYG
ncbi:MAG: magnesium transporter [Pseudomonadales bacterium]|nr:magnesium transporter [Pseudomonadales bacterium]NRA18678.1 magnesium transporter [Oceanospirillaceae bacterium]